MGACLFDTSPFIKLFFYYIDFIISTDKNAKAMILECANIGCTLVRLRCTVVQAISAQLCKTAFAQFL